MREIPELFDADLLAMRRARAGGADFLREAVARGITDRLNEVNRTFRSPAVVGPRGAVWAEAMRTAGLSEPVLRPDAAVLDLAEGAHDLVIHAMALHWAEDPVGQIIQARRALRPDGLFLAMGLGGQTLTELRAALGQAEIEVTGGLSPRVAPMAEIRDMGALLQRAGLALPVADSWTLRAEYDSAMHLMRDLRAMGETNALHTRLRHPTRRTVFERAAELYADGYATAQGRVPASFEIIALTGWAPDASQPQPLRPGSAGTRLADALNTRESPLGD